MRGLVLRAPKRITVARRSFFVEVKKSMYIICIYVKFAYICTQITTIKI